MGALTRIGWLAPSNNSRSSTANQSASFRRFSSLHHRQIHIFKTLTVSVIKGPCPVSERAEEDVLEAFFRDRELNGDLITKASDILFQREARKSDTLHDGTSQQVPETSSNESEGGFLKLSKTQEWVSGENTAPLNRKSYRKGLQDDSERRKRLNFLKYAALKRELMLLTVAIGAACSGYCLITLSVQAAMSYAAGVVFSCLYLQLLYRHVDDISRDTVPQTFMQKKSKKIGIRSEDLKDFLERSVKGSGIALSSPRLVIPAAIYGLWLVSHRYIANDVFDFQIVPAMLGMFAYKGAALVQVYRDNENLQIVFPENEQSSSD
ncbi:hypothetical protein Nepgr_009178 [Nepenthes gracilis]|uniref:CGL160/ATPI domain-containing protein n=1 Tax=Nepenthes gracilis TaxID=150966 RepID=A0AAD3SA23_NEPGR|nr:hypothetical protein Nepgr_009178 [Nepenthes gracilis]